MTDVTELLSNEALTKEDLNNEIKERMELIRQMVGQLYPSILRDEILKLREKYFLLFKTYDYS